MEAAVWGFWFSSLKVVSIQMIRRASVLVYDSEIVIVSDPLCKTSFIFVGQ